MTEIIILDDKDETFEEITKERAYTLAIMLEIVYHNGKSGNERKYFWPKEKPMTEEEKLAEFEHSTKQAMDYLGLKDYC